MFNQQTAKFLKSNRLLFLKQGKSKAILGKPGAERYQQLLQEFHTYITDKVLLISEVGQLSIYLQKVPDLAWDIIEFSEKSLQVIFPQPKSVPEYFFTKDNAIAIRVEVKGNFHKILYNMGGPLVLTKVTEFPPPDDFLEQYDNMLNLPDNYEWKIKPDRILSLGVDGEIKFHA